MLERIKWFVNNKLHRTMAVMLILAMALTMLPTLTSPVSAQTATSVENVAFKVTTYDISARIEVPQDNTATSYQVYLSTANTLNTSTATKVLDSSSYTAVVYAENLTANTPYYFYSVINGGTTAIATVSATTDASPKYWTDASNYDSDWYNTVTTHYASYNSTTIPVVISTSGQLAAFSMLVNSGKNFSGKLVTLNESVDMSAYLWTPIGTSNTTNFASTFDGLSHEITGLHTNDTSRNYQGLFGYAGSGSAINNTGVVKGYIKGKDYVGCVAGSSAGTISNCYNTGSVTGTGVFGYVGGVVGSSTGAISNCYNTGSVNSTGSEVGGVVGKPYKTTNCYNTGSVSGNWEVGGVAGYTCDSTTNCYNTGVVSGFLYVGGVIGFSYNNTTSYCYNTGPVSGSNSDIGGIVGGAQGEISYSYNTGAVSGPRCVGGITGIDTGSGSNSYIKYNYNTGSISGTSNVGGIVGNNNSYLQDNYYCGYSGGNGTDTAAATDENGKTTPFIAYISPLGKGRFTSIVELDPASLNSTFKSAFGITGIQYPDAYESSDTNILTVEGKTITANASTTGIAFVNGLGTGTSPTSKIIISQNALNMSNTTSHFSGAGETTAVQNVKLPVTVDTSTNGSIPIGVTVSATASPTVGQAVTFSATLIGETSNSGRTITFSLKDALNNPVSLDQSTAITNASGVATLANAWTPDTVGTYTVTVSYVATDGQTKTGTATITITPAITVSSVAVKTAPTKVVYTAGDPLDLTGLVVTLTKSDTNTQEVALANFGANGITTVKANAAALVVGDTDVAITVNGHTVNQAITVSPAAITVSSVAVKTAPTKVVYTAGDPLDLTGLVVTLTKSDTNTQEVALANFGANGITTVKANGAALVVGDTDVAITVNGHTVNQAITVSPAVTTYTVSIGTLTGGTITASLNSATAGTIINLTITPNTAKQLKAGTLGYNDGTAHAISETSFIMPAANVTVTAEFEAASLPPYEPPSWYSVYGVNLDKTTLSLNVGEAPNTLKASILPNYASNPAVGWSSSEPSVASVNGGVVMPLTAGKTTITVTTNDGGKTASCTVLVIPSPGKNTQWDERQAEQSVTKDKTWRVKFSKAVDPESINRQNIMVLDSNNEPVEIDVKVDAENDKIILVTPKDSYKAGERYRLYLGAGLDSSTGKSLSKGILFRFTVE